MIEAVQNGEGSGADGRSTAIAVAAVSNPVPKVPFAEKEKKRLSIRASNIKVWQDGPKAPKGPLDSNIKKNTAFMKRIRQSLGVESKEQILKEAATLNLDKYIEEIVQAIPEGLGKCNNSRDSLAAAESLSALHARFDPQLFALPLANILAGQLTMPSREMLQAMSAEQREKEEQARVQKQRTLLKASAELALTELFRHDKGKAKAESQEDTLYPGQDWLYQTIRELLVNDREHVNSPLLISLLKVMGSSLLSPAENAPLDASSSVEERVVSKEMQSKYRKLFEMYFSTLGKRIVKEHSRLQEQDKRNHEAYIRSGEIFEDRQQNYEKMARSFERTHEWGKTLSDLLGVPLPSLTNESRTVSAAGLAVNLDTRSSAQDLDETDISTGKSKWEDEETRRFYEDLVDLEEMVPPALLRSSKTKGEGATVDEKKGGGEDISNASKMDGVKSEVSSPQMGSNTVQELQNGDLEKSNEEEVTGNLAAGPAAQLNALFASLSEMTNRAMIDSAAVDFAFLNNKLARRKLIKHILSISRNRNDLVPYYARLVATLNKYMPDIGQGVIDGLDEEFRFLQRKKNVDMAETRAKNARFIGELVKFNVTPIITIFHVFKVCLDDFNGPNIDNIATLLETCGRYLLRNEETSERMRCTLELLRRKKTAQNLDARQLVALDNAYYQCNPPEREAIVFKKRTPMEHYINHLIYGVLARHKEDKVLKLIRKLKWDDRIVRETLQNVFTRSWRIKFSNLHLLAVLLFDIQTYHFDFVVYVIDTVCEQIRVGMETNVFKDNQRRVASVKYLGELYNYRLINTDMIFEQLWSLVTFGHPHGRPFPGQISSIDAPDDYFRCRLVCTLLDVCGVCFDRGVLRDRLDDYLLMFNVYVLSKHQPLPMDVDFMLSDTLESLRPGFVLKKNFEEAAQALDEMLSRQRAAEAAAEAALQAKKDQANAAFSGKAESLEVEEDEDKDGVSLSDTSSETSTSSSDDEEGAPRHVSKDDASTDSGPSSDEMETDSEDENEEEGEDLEEASTRRTERMLVDQEAEDEFERELAKMMAESSITPAPNTGSKRGLFDIGLPFIKKAAANSQQVEQQATQSIHASPDLGEEPGEAIQHMRFSLLSKKGNKQHTQDVHVPIDAALAVNSRAAEQKQLAERQQLKKLVLGIETREQAEDRAMLDASLAKRGFRVKQNRG